MHTTPRKKWKKTGGWCRPPRLEFSRFCRVSFVFSSQTGHLLYLPHAVSSFLGFSGRPSRIKPWNPWNLQAPLLGFLRQARRVKLWSLWSLQAPLRKCWVIHIYIFCLFPFCLYYTCGDNKNYEIRTFPAHPNCTVGSAYGLAFSISHPTLGPLFAAGFSGRFILWFGNMWRDRHRRHLNGSMVASKNNPSVGTKLTWLCKSDVGAKFRWRLRAMRTWRGGGGGKTHRLILAFHFPTKWARTQLKWCRSGTETQPG